MLLAEESFKTYKQVNKIKLMFFARSLVVLVIIIIIISYYYYYYYYYYCFDDFQTFHNN